MNIRVVALKYQPVRVSRIPWDEGVLEAGANNELHVRWKSRRVAGMISMPMAKYVITLVAFSAVVAVCLPPNDTVNLAQRYFPILLKDLSHILVSMHGQSCHAFANDWREGLGILSKAQVEENLLPRRVLNEE